MLHTQHAANVKAMVVVVSAACSAQLLAASKLRHTCGRDSRALLLTESPSAGWSATVCQFASHAGYNTYTLSFTPCVHNPTARGLFVHACVCLHHPTRQIARLALVCRSQGSSGASSSSSSPDDTTPLPSQQQQQPQAASNADASRSHEGWHPPEQQLLRTAWKRLQALEAYQELLGRAGDGSSGSGSSSRERKAGDTPADVAAKIAADRDEVPLLDAAILIAQVCWQRVVGASVFKQLVSAGPCTFLCLGLQLVVIRKMSRQPVRSPLQLNSCSCMPM